MYEPTHVNDPSSKVNLSRNGVGFCPLDSLSLRYSWGHQVTKQYIIVGLTDSFGVLSSSPEDGQIQERHKEQEESGKEAPKEVCQQWAGHVAPVVQPDSRAGRRVEVFQIVPSRIWFETF